MPLVSAWLRRMRAFDAYAPQPAVCIAAVSLAAVALLLAKRLTVIGISPSIGYEATIAIVLAASIVVAYRYPIHLRHQTKVFLFTVPYFLLAVLLPPPLAALAAGLGALTGELSRRKSSGSYAADMATETARRVMQVLLASVVAHVSGTPPAFLALLCSIAVLSSLEILTFPLVIAPMSGERPIRALIAGARASAPSETVLCVVAVLGAAAAVTYPWTLPLLVVPAVLVFSATKVLREMQDSTRNILESMADAVDLRDPYTGGHSRRVADLSAQILRALAVHGPEVDLILAAARVHDIGKIGVPDAVLNKPGPLDEAERAMMEMHPVLGVSLLKRYPDFARGCDIVRHHHERWDGAGYPDRLVGVTTPFGARVVAVADSFDAMTSDRPYRRGMSIWQAIEILRDGRAKQWDAAIVDAFLASLDTAPDDPVSNRARGTAVMSSPIAVH